MKKTIKSFSKPFITKRAVYFTTIYNCLPNNLKEELEMQEKAILSYCKKNKIQPIRSFRENHLGKQNERPVWRHFINFLNSNSHDIDIIIFPSFFKVFAGEDEMQSHIMELNYNGYEVQEVKMKKEFEGTTFSNMSLECGIYN